MRTVLVSTIAATLFALAPVLAQQAGAPLTVISAQRAKSYATRSGEIKPSNAAADVVIVIRVTGLTLEQFRRVGQGMFHVKAGDEDLPPSSVLSGVVDGTPELKAVFVGPKAILDLRLVLGSHTPVDFKAEEAIVEQLR